MFSGEDSRCLYAFECADMKLRDSLPYRGCYGGYGSFHETMSDAVVHPIGNVVQAGSVNVDFAVAIADALQGACVVGIVYRAIL